MRRLLVPAFSARRMRRLEADVAQLVDTLLDDVERRGAGGAPVDLHEHFSVPLPIFVICQLLGVPVEDRAYFKDLSERAATTTGDDPLTAVLELMAYTGRLADAKRIEPAEDLVAAQREDPMFDDAQLAMLVAGLLFAGHETTVNRISLGVVMLLGSPNARLSLVSDLDTVGPVVEEVLRLAAPDAFGLARWAREEIVVGEGSGHVVIGAGDAVIFATSAANRDEQVFADPEQLDPGRPAGTGHLSFGHGAHFCIGAMPGPHRAAPRPHGPVRPPARTAARRAGRGATAAHRAAHRRTARAARHLVSGDGQCWLGDGPARTRARAAGRRAPQPRAPARRDPRRHPGRRPAVRRERRRGARRGRPFHALPAL